MSDPNNYTVGWICAISTEYTAAQCFLDEKHGRPKSVSPNDGNDYTFGSMGGHNVVIAVLPDGEYGTNFAAAVARDMLHSFPNVKIGLMVGIGGGAPSSKNDIRLGDIVVSSPANGKGGVYQYDMGKAIQGQGFQHSGFLNKPPTLLSTAVNGLKSQYAVDGHRISEKIEQVLAQKKRLKKTHGRPDPGSDRLYISTKVHEDQTKTCESVCRDEERDLITRPPRDVEEVDDPAIFYGLIASANQVMKDATLRDRLADGENVLCFEMEAAGLMNHFPCLVVRGICDYSDSHKNKAWQGYAAMTAAAYTKDLLNRIPPNKIEAEKKISEVLSNAEQRKFDKKEDQAILDVAPSSNNPNRPQVGGGGGTPGGGGRPPGGGTFRFAGGFVGGFTRASVDAAIARDRTLFVVRTGYVRWRMLDGFSSDNNGYTKELCDADWGPWVNTFELEEFWSADLGGPSSSNDNMLRGAFGRMCKDFGGSMMVRLVGIMGVCEYLGL
ncbi:hypothetical protein RB595_010547 [Gaeumannomyces hyphopodioides]